MSGRIATKGRIEYQFQAFGSVSLVFVEVKYDIKERSKAIAQVIAECDACDHNNKQIRAPIYGILCDGSGFQFFQFSRRTEAMKPHKFAVGAFPGSRYLNGRGLPIDDISASALPFILSMRPICETIYNLLLESYITTLKAFRQRNLSRLGQGDHDTLASSDQAIILGERALAMSQIAEGLRQQKVFVGIDEFAEIGLRSLKPSTEAVPNGLLFAVHG